MAMESEKFLSNSEQDFGIHLQNEIPFCSSPFIFKKKKLSLKNTMQ